MSRDKLYIVGAGMGHDSQITGQGIEAMDEADIVYAFDRIAELYLDKYPYIIACDYTTLIEQLQDEIHSKIVVLVSGDVGFFSMAKTLQNRFHHKYEIESICGINSMQYLCAKLAISYEKVHVLSLHGRDSISRVLGSVSYNEYTFLLTGGQNKTQVILEYLDKNIEQQALDTSSDEQKIIVTIGDKLSMKEEKIVSGGISELCKENTFSDLTVMMIHNPNYKQKNKHYRDDAFIRSNVPMSKRDIRNLSVDYLDIKATDIVYDIGAGTGSVTIELASFANEGMVYALEKNPEAYETILINKAKFGSYNVQPILCSALEELHKLPAADKVFVGGSSGDLREMLQVVFSRNPKVEVLVTAITLETLNLAMQALKEMELEHEITCINSSYSRKLGSYHLMTANNPIYLIWAKQSEAEA